MASLSKTKTIAASANPTTTAATASTSQTSGSISTAPLSSTLTSGAQRASTQPTSTGPKASTVPSSSTTATATQSSVPKSTAQIGSTQPTSTVPTATQPPVALQTPPTSKSVPSVPSRHVVAMLNKVEMEKFTGAEGPMWESWIDRFEDYLAVTYPTMTADDQKAKILRFFLDGPAQAFIETLPSSTSYKEINDYLKAKFSSETRRITARALLSECRQLPGESVIAFVDRLTRTFHMAVGRTLTQKAFEERLAQEFIEKVRTDVRFQLMTQGTTDLSAAIEKARTLESFLPAQPLHDQLPPVNWSRNETSQWTRPQEVANRNQINRYDHSDHERFLVQRSRERDEERYSEKRRSSPPSTSSFERAQHEAQNDHLRNRSRFERTPSRFNDEADELKMRALEAQLHGLKLENRELARILTGETPTLSTEQEETAEKKKLAKTQGAKKKKEQAKEDVNEAEADVNEAEEKKTQKRE
ncbi:unnamed protein product [Caenorhabditis auriculariae]|uniref:Retrotransposon gag domain-containing protein n=1 Tax=Caenorhabditis auriculariae TaxID=2777116 RepID=A0A8S1HHW1_9PELO|nr:unnamed protein product [Caenorhabditis auriculariae]